MADDRKPLPQGATMAQRAADIQAGRSEAAGHEMIRKKPPPKRSISDIVLGAGKNIGQRIRGAVFPKAETERQKKLKEAGAAAAGVAGAVAGAKAGRVVKKRMPLRKPLRKKPRKENRKSNRNSGRR